MRVGHNGGGAAAGGGPGEFKGRGKAGFDVDVRVDETRTQEFVRAVQFCPSPVASHARNHAARHRHVCSDDFLGKNIDHVDVFEHEVGGGAPPPPRRCMLCPLSLSGRLSCFWFLPVYYII